MPVTITTRAGKGSAILAAENDANLAALQGGVFAVTAVKTSAYTAANLEIVRTDTTSAAFTVTLPASPTDAMRVIVEDSATAGSWSVNALTVSPNGSKINNGTAALALTGKGARVELAYAAGAGTWLTRYQANLKPLVGINNLSEISGPTNQAAAKANLGIAEAPGAAVTSLGGTYAGGTSLFSSAHGQLPQNTVTLAALTEYWSPFWWPWGWAPTLLGLDVTTAVTGAQVKCAVYAMGASYAIGAQLATSGTLSGATAGIVTRTVAPAWPGPGLYWTGYHSDQAVTLRAFAVSSHLPLLPYKSAGGGTGYLARAGVAFASALPSTAPALSALSPGPPGTLAAVLLGVP